MTTPAQQRPLMAAGGASLIINSGNHRHLGANTPLILNLSQLQGSNGLIILSSQSNTPISIVNNGLLGNTVASSTASGNLMTTNTSTPVNPNNPQLMDSIPASSAPSAAAGSSAAAAVPQGQGRQQHGGQGHLQASILGHGQHVHMQGSVLQGAGHIRDTHQPATTDTLSDPGMKPSTAVNGNAGPQVLHGGLVLKQEIQDEEKSNVSMEDCASEVQQVLNHGEKPGNAGRTNHHQPLMPADLDNSMEIGQGSGSYRDQSQSSTMDDIVSELNLKNEMHNFTSSGLVMTPDDIHKALTANLPVAGTSLDDHTQNAANQSTTSLDSIEAIRSSLVSPQSTDFNFDAFDILDVLPDFDSSDHIVADISPTHPPTPPVTSSVATTSAAATSQSSSCTSCQNNNQLENKSENRAGIANITDFSPEWSYAEGGVKVLVTGPWYSTTSPYTVLFDNNSVPATLVQSGVLRCFCPGKENW